MLLCASLSLTLTGNDADGRAYVGLGRLLVRQRRYGEAQALYEDGARMTEGSNCYIWQVRRPRTAGQPPEHPSSSGLASEQALMQAWATLEVRRRDVKHGAHAVPGRPGCQQGARGLLARLGPPGEVRGEAWERLSAGFSCRVCLSTAQTVP